MNQEIEPTPFDVEVEDDSGQEYPWAPQPGETALGFQYFCVYRDLGARRSVAAAARAVGRDASILRQLSAKFSWPDRALAYDAWLDRKAVEELARGRTKMRAEHAGIAELAREKILARLKTLDPEELGARDLATWLDLSVKIERQARGEPDKVTRHEHEVNVVDQLDAEGRRSLMAEAMAVLQERMGSGLQTDELEASIIEAEEVEDDGGS